MLLIDFYKITGKVKNENGSNFELLLNPHHPVYEGHFPSQPVLPGVCTLQIIKECAEEMIHNNLQFGQITTCKYLSSVDPTANNSLKLSVSLSAAEDNTYQIIATGYHGDIIFIKLKATMKIAE